MIYSNNFAKSFLFLYLSILWSFQAHTMERPQASHQPPSLEPNTQTLLHQAASTGNAKMLITLIEQGADVNRLDDQGASPLASALKSGHELAVLVLIEHGASIDGADINKNEILKLFAEWPFIGSILYEDLAVLEQSYVRLEYVGQISAAFMYAVSQGRSIAFQKLLARYPLSHQDLLGLLKHIRHILSRATLTEIQCTHYQTIMNILIERTRPICNTAGSESGISFEFAVELLIRFGIGPLSRLPLVYP